MKNAALIVAAGVGSRFDSSLPKQYSILGSKCILAHTIEKFLSHPNIDVVLVAISKDHIDLYESHIAYHQKLLPFIYGGATRQESVLCGLEELSRHNIAKVLIHDAARPFVTDKIISDSISMLDKFYAVDTSVSVYDTIKLRESKDVVDRDTLYATQTPQSFNFDTIYNLHQKYKGRNFTDDIALAKEDDIKIGIVEGDRMNFKITTKEDLTMATKLIAKHYITKVGMGFDVHEIQKADNAFIPICGVHIPSEYKVIAHSDGDVGLHALVDALLGTIGAGDIGQHFPPSDPKWKDCDSLVFLSHASSLIKEKGGLISNIDITILCETPKINPNKDAMTNKISQALEINENLVNVKATTTEKLGFLGRKEGIAANAVATVRFEEFE